VLYICAASGHPDACILPDVYHLYKGGSSFAELGLLSGSRVHVFHMNDYPSDPARPQIQDADRVYPTDGVAPLKEILGTMRDNGFRGALSLELFNRSYWAQDPRLVAKTGIEKMKQAVALLD
jgi:sugar phosphate isomerase/epimerase